MTVSPVVHSCTPFIPLATLCCWPSRITDWTVLHLRVSYLELSCFSPQSWAGQQSLQKITQIWWESVYLAENVTADTFLAKYFQFRVLKSKRPVNCNNGWHCGGLWAVPSTLEIADLVRTLWPDPRSLIYKERRKPWENRPWEDKRRRGKTTQTGVQQTKANARHADRHTHYRAVSASRCVSFRSWQHHTPYEAHSYSSDC